MLILSSQQFGKSSANGSCANYIYLDLKKRGIDPYVVCYNDSIVQNLDSRCVSLHYKKKCSNTLGRFSKIINFYNSVLLQIIRPAYDKSLCDKMVKEAYGLICKNRIDVILVFYFSAVFPAQLIEVSRRLLKKNPSLKVLLYELDSVEDGIGGTSVWNKLITKSYIRYLKSFYKRIYHVYVLKSHVKKWKDNYGKYIQKMTEVDTPVLDCEYSIDNKQNYSDENKIVFIYAGALSPDYRPPNRMVDFFNAFSQRNECELWVYSKGCDSFLLDESRKNSCIKLMGYVSEEELKKALQKSSVMISIGNSRSNSYPSKLIKYFTYCKPVIHFELKENDICQNYLSRYPLGFTVKGSTLIKEAALDFEEFLCSSKDISVDVDMIKNEFFQNTPTFSVDMIINSLKK